MNPGDVKHGRPTSSNRVLLTVSGTIPADIEAQIAKGRRPRADYLEMARAFGADLLDVAAARRETNRIGRLVGRVAGDGGLLAWECFRRRRRYDVVFTDGEQVGLPYAALTRALGVTSKRRPRHLMIGHILSTKSKAAMFRSMRLRGCVDTIFVYSTAQRRFVIDQLRVPDAKVVLIPFMVDTAFFSPRAKPARRPSGARPLVCSVGQERRDHPTMMAAVEDLPVDCAIAAASPWSKHHDSSADRRPPANVRVVRLDLFELRQLYADSDIVVVPLVEVDFQAGVTTILEAMAMGKPVVCTRTTGQTDVIVDGVTGIYVPPGDPAALRAAISGLVDDPERARALGEAGRRLAEAELDVTTYAQRLARHVDDARGARHG